MATDDSATGVMQLPEEAQRPMYMRPLTGSASGPSPFDEEQPPPMNEAIQGAPSQGKEQFHNTMADFDHRKDANRASMIGLDPSDPDYTKKLSALQAQHGALTTEKARFQMLHPWGGPDAPPAPPVYGGPGKPVEQGAMIPEKQSPGDEFKYREGDLKNKIAGAEGDPNQWAEAKGEMARFKMDNPWGSPGNHPGVMGKIGHVLGDVGNVLGNTTLGKDNMEAIPGTSANMQAQEQGSRAAMGNEEDLAQKAAQTKLTKMQAENVGKTNPEQALHDLMTGDNGNPRINPETSKPYSYLEAYDAITRVGQESKNPPLQNPDQLNQMLASRYQVLHPGATLPTQYALPANATKADYDRIDKGLEQEEKAGGTAAQQQTLNQMRQEAHQLAAQNSQFEHQRQTENDQERRDQHTQQDYDKNVAPVQGDLDYIDAYKQSKHTGPGDEALMEKFFDLAKPSSGFRMSQPQITMLNTARSWMEGTKALAYHALTGTWFSDEQRQQIMDTMHALADGKMKALQGGPKGEQRKTEAGNSKSQPTGGGIQVERDANGRIIGIK